MINTKTTVTDDTIVVQEGECSMEGTVEIETTMSNGGEKASDKNNAKSNRSKSSAKNESNDVNGGVASETTENEVAKRGSVAESNNNERKGGNRNNRVTSGTRRRRKQYAVSTRWEREMAEKAREMEMEENPIKQFNLTGTNEDCNNCFCCCANQIGGMFSLLEEEDGTPIVIAGPCWPFCTFVTLPLILVSSLLILFFIILNSKGPIPWWLAIIYIPLLFVVLVSLFLVSCRDPGLLERVTDEEAGESGWFWNEQVASFRPAGAMYCRECKVLIQDYDHLCPWTGTGIGRGNILAFRVFVVAVNLLCYCSIGIVAYFLLKGILKSDEI